MDGKQDYDVLGFIYEYLISNFAANAGKKAGEFYTPHGSIALNGEIVAQHPREEWQGNSDLRLDEVVQETYLLISGASFLNIDDDDNIKYFAQELKQNTYNLTRMNLVMRGILPSKYYDSKWNTLEVDWPYFESDPVGSYNPLYVDAVVSIRLILNNGTQKAKTLTRGMPVLVWHQKGKLIMHFYFTICITSNRMVLWPLFFPMVFYFEVVKSYSQELDWE